MERDLTGQVLDGRYRVLGPLGKGAMGGVYRAEQVNLGRPVAVKFIHEQVTEGSATKRRFDREAMAMAKLEHPHCAAILDVGVHEEQPFVVMELVNGGNLAELVEQGPVPIDRAVELTRQILSGLSHAHESGIIHRDIKPANVVLSQKTGLGDHVKIVDFGLAKLDRESSDLTRGIVIGTPSYMAPEQILGQLVDRRVDLYACGVVLFELLTGTKPFRSENYDPVQVCMMHLNVEPPRLAERLPGRDFGALEGVVARALQKKRDDRFATADEFAAALSTAVGRAPYRTPPLGIATPAALGATMPLQPQPASQPAMVPPTAMLPPPPVARAEPSAPSTSAASPPRRSRRPLVLAAIGAIVLAVIVVLAAGGGSSSTRAGAAPQDAASVATADAAIADERPPPETDGADSVLARARELASGGRREAAIDLLAKARKTYRDDARLPYAAGMLYLDKMWWRDGLEQLRAAIALDPAYREDAELVKAVVRGFNTTASYDSMLASFLRKDIGPAAKAALEQTAEGHPNPIIRKRAQAELRRYR